MRHPTADSLRTTASSAPDDCLIAPAMSADRVALRFAAWPSAELDTFSDDGRPGTRGRNRHARIDTQKGAALMDRTQIGRRLALALGTSALLVGTVAVPAFAADTVTQTVGAGTRTASVADLTLAAVTTTHVAQTSTGSMTLTADDSSGSGTGWDVTVLTSAFVYSGANSGVDIPAENFLLTSSAAPVMTAGQAIDATGTDAAPTGPQLGTLAGVSGTLDAARKTILAGVNFGQGTYTQDLAVSLTIPAESRAGAYTGTLTTTITAAP